MNEPVTPRFSVRKIGRLHLGAGSGFHLLPKKGTLRWDIQYKDTKSYLITIETWYWFRFHVVTRVDIEHFISEPTVTL